MPRSTLLLGAGIAAALAVACVPLPAAPPAPQVTAATCDFAAKVYWLPDGSNWSPWSRTAPPQGQPVQGTYAVDLNEAYKLASPHFKARLCGLDGVYIDQTPCNSWGECLGRSWGMRLRNPATGNGRYIGLSSSLWDDRPAYSEFERRTLLSVLPLTPSPPTTPITFVNGDPSADTFAMTVLAALAHEMGHVRWYETVVPQASNGTYDYDFSQLCGGNFFASWAGPPGNLKSKPRWRYLLTTRERNIVRPIYDTHASDPQTKQIDQLVKAGKYKDAGDKLDGIYAPTAPWASFFASLSPDEDFVETYKLKVLTTATDPATPTTAPTAPLTSLMITMPGKSGDHTEDVPAAYLAALNGGDPSKMPLVTKAQCIPDTL